MEFTLVYKGQLKSNGNVKQKQEIRRAFHPQLMALWQCPPLDTMEDRLQEKPKKGESILKPVGSFRFVTIVNSNFKNFAELDIIFLRPSPPGAIISSGGDIDNRLKTLFDALRMPRDNSEIPNGDSPGADERPFFCLLEDDSLITKVSVQTDQLLGSSFPNNHVELLIRVKTKATFPSFFNLFSSL